VPALAQDAHDIPDTGDAFDDGDPALAARSVAWRPRGACAARHLRFPTLP
jgi:hypothetical protein